jgi:hypothetical protein
MKTKKRKMSVNSNNRVANLKKVNCSPKDKKELNDFSCYTDKSLHKLKEIWNTKHPDMKINTNNTNMHNHSSGSSKPARIRTVLNEKQLQTLRACYGANPRPDALMKEQLVEMTGLNPRVIRVWFQNKRCKDKKKNMLGRSDQPMALPLHYNSNPLNNFNNTHLHNHHHHMVNLNNPHPSLMYDNCY